MVQSKEIEVKLKCYGGSASEDAEHFFEAFEKLLKCRDEEYREIKKAKTRDASVLYKAMNEMLTMKLQVHCT